MAKAQRTALSSRVRPAPQPPRPLVSHRPRLGLTLLGALLLLAAIVLALRWIEPPTSAFMLEAR